MSLPAEGFGRLIFIPLPVSPKQLTASNTAGPFKWAADFPGRVVGFRARPGVIGAGTAATGIVVRIKKNSTVLHSVDIVLQSSSTALNNSATLMDGTLVALLATRKFAVDDTFQAEVELTGGSTITLDGTGIDLYVMRD